MTQSEAPRAVAGKQLGAWVVVVFVLFLGAWPWLEFLDTWPTSRDATIWISRGAPTSADWLQWDLATRHFNVGYRPVTAMSYTANYLVGGFASWPYRLTDLALHVVCGLLVYLVFLRLAPSLPRWGGIVATGLFMAHPVTEQIVPHLARRSYSLAAALSLAALCVLCPGPSGSSSRGRSLLGGLLLAGAVLSNEAVYLAAAIVPLLLSHGLAARPDRWKRLLSTCALPALLVLLALAARVVVVGGVGGYPDRPDRFGRAIPIAMATGRALGAVGSSPETGRDGAPGAVLAVAILVAVYLVWRSFAGSFRGGAGDTDRLPGLLLLWTVGYALLFAPLGVWFPRQVYVVLVPFALLVGVIVAKTAVRYAADRRSLAAHLVPQVLLLTWVLFQSPVVRGVDPTLRACWRKTDALLRNLDLSVRALPEPSVVSLAVPYYTRPPVYAFRARERGDAPPLGSRQPAQWMHTLLAGRAVKVESLLIFEQDPLENGTVVTYDETEGVQRLVLDRGTTVHLLGSGTKALQTDTAEVVRVDPVAGPPGAQFLYFHDGSRGRMIDRQGTAALTNPDRPGPEG